MFSVLPRPTFLQFMLLGGIFAVCWQLWSPEGVLAREKELSISLRQQLEHNEVERAKNEKLAAELYSLQNTSDAIEERARRELFMVRPDEVLFRLEKPEEAQERDRNVAAMPDYSNPNIPPGSKPTFRPKRDHLYSAPKNLRAPPSRDKRK